MNYLYLFFCKLIIVCVSALPVEGCTTKCHSKEQNAHLHLATKTPYRYLINNNDAPIAFEGCTPEKIWLLVRHGTRNPSQKVIRKMRERLPIIRDFIIKSAEQNKSSLCDEEVANLMNWTTDLQDADEKRLTHEGEDEMIELAERYQNRFPDLLSENYTNSTFRFRYTATQRTAESARYFTVGLFGRRVSRYVWFPEALYRDPILRFYKLCSRWRSQVKKNPEALRERSLFEKGPEMEIALQEIRERLGLEKNITVDDATLMYVTCAFETAWHWRNPSPWCAVFSEKNLETFEYQQDLQYYWVDGYGYDLTYKQACPIMGDIFSFFEGGGEERASVYFTHSGTLLKVLAHLGLYRDARPLRHDDGETRSSRRLWRVSRIDAFGTNLAFALFRCAGGERRVLLLHQERPVTLPGCPDDGLCPLDALRAAFRDSLDHCNFHALCTLDPQPAPRQSPELR